MAESYPTSGASEFLPITIPSLDDQANIQEAFKKFYYNTFDPTSPSSTESGLSATDHSVGGYLKTLFTTKANYTDKLSAFATTSSSELASRISDETGSGALVFANTPTLVTPVLGVATATSINGTSIPTSKTLLTTDAGQVTNTMLAGSIANAKLTNSKVTVGTTDISLGGSSTTLAGLTSVTSTSFTGALTGNASTATTLQNARTINGVSFDGSADITVPTAAGTLTGNTLASNITTSSLTAVGTISTGVWNATAIAVSKLANGTSGYVLKAGASSPEWVSMDTIPVSSAAKVANAITFNSSGSGNSSEQVFDGSSTTTISYNTIGAAPTSHTHTISDVTDLSSWTGSSSITTVGTLANLTVTNTISGSVTNGVTSTITLTSGSILKGGGSKTVAVASASDIVAAIGSTAVANATNASAASTATTATTATNIATSTKVSILDSGTSGSPNKSMVAQIYVQSSEPLNASTGDLWFW